MGYLSVAETAKKWHTSERTVRNYCAQGRVPGAFLTGKTWNIPEEAQKPNRVKNAISSPLTLLSVLQREKETRMPGGIYHRIQIDLTYNSNHIEGSRLSREQTRFIFETNTIGVEKQAVNVDDIVETTNHFRCIDTVIDEANRTLSQAMIKRLHGILKSGTSDSRQDWFAVGDYKKVPNEVGGQETIAPEDVESRMRALLNAYNAKTRKTLRDLLDFHVQFESIHPFQDGNGRIGRLILFKECLKYDIVPFIITDDLKMFYYRGIREWKTEPGYLTDTCLTAQDHFKALMDYFRIPYAPNA